jgi:S-adenosyl methyltransferase
MSGKGAVPDFSVPNPSRMYDYLLGGKDNFPADREAANRVIAAYPEARALARANRRFLTRAVWFLAEHGISQYIDLGTGLPTSPNVHQVARQVRPDARVVYVDNDPVVTCHGQALCATNDGVAVIDGDIRDPRSILADPELTAVIDFAEPVAILCVAVLHFIRDEENPP